MTPSAAPRAVWGTGDGQPDRVVNATNGNDTIDVSGDAGDVKASGLTATIGILHAEAANDRLEINTLAGTDSVDSAGLAAGAIQLFVDGVLVPLSHANQSRQGAQNETEDHALHRGVVRRHALLRRSRRHHSASSERAAKRALVAHGLRLPWYVVTASGRAVESTPSASGVTDGGYGYGR